MAGSGEEESLKAERKAGIHGCIVERHILRVVESTILSLEACSFLCVGTGAMNRGLFWDKFVRVMYVVEVRRCLSSFSRY